MMNAARNRSEEETANRTRLVSCCAINDIDILALKSDASIIHSQIT
jgi:hypothetical protein